MKKRKTRAQRSRSFRCPHCGAAMILRPASEIYHDAKSDRKLYVCHNYPACNTYVAAHPNTDKPMGVPANGNLRNLRIQAHRKFDLIWKNGIMTREEAYRWFADSFTRISIPNRPLLTYDDFYAIGCEAICRAALKYQPDMGAFAPFACRYIYNAIVDHCRAMNYRLERNVEISEDENASLLDMLTCTSVDFDETVTDATAMSALAACKEKYNGVARKGV